MFSLAALSLCELEDKLVTPVKPLEEGGEKEFAPQPSWPSGLLAVPRRQAPLHLRALASLCQPTHSPWEAAA